MAATSGNATTMCITAIVRRFSGTFSFEKNSSAPTARISHGTISGPAPSAATLPRPL